MSAVQHTLYLVGTCPRENVTMLWVILVVMLAGAGLLSEQLQRSDNRRQAVDVSALAHNFLIYRTRWPNTPTTTRASLARRRILHWPCPPGGFTQQE
ncbi:hypothetical protein [Pseudomonas oryzihabitans]|uniref:hypothetical protein n=1 Tax=Pseudomonas oryzihabitans TaxID=47885 RepID=UPI0021B173D5|nr:hypothetical protein [Pseudomonas psychrotolerans]